MKKKDTILILSIFICFLSGWNRAMAQEPLDFYAYENNPVLTHGAPGSYDGELLIGPYALWNDESFYLFYTGNAGICLATSPDGYNFEKDSCNDSNIRQFRTNCGQTTECEPDKR